MSLHHAFVFAAVALFTASCVSTYRAPQTPTLKSRQSGEWHRTANRIQSDQYTIFYHGTAQREPPSKRNRWAGTIRGDIFVTGRQGYILIPNGGLTISPNNSIRVEGASRMIVLDQPHSN